ncbi:MAG: DUF4258 domain-containing protein [Gammaproteobacteria bacterium]|nr:DUF4258 domain-containing protein [Gammaproteobacteria bacterium]
MNSKIINSANKKILFLPHAIKQLSHPDRMITTDEIRESIYHGEIIEEYHDDPRGESYLLLHILSKQEENRAIHVVCAPKDEYLAIITAYLPALDQWHSDLKKRK